jgi:hypothetical protein
VIRIAVTASSYDATWTNMIKIFSPTRPAPPGSTTPPASFILHAQFHRIASLSVGPRPLELGDRVRSDLVQRRTKRLAAGLIFEQRRGRSADAFQPVAARIMPAWNAPGQPTARRDKRVVGQCAVTLATANQILAHAC